MIKKQKAYLLPSTLVILILAGCQSAPRDPEEGLPNNIYSPTGPVVLAIEKDIEAGRLSRPIGNNATEKLHRLTVIDPNDANITRLRDKIALRLTTFGQRAFRKENYGLTIQLAQRALAVAPEHADALALLDAAQEAQQLAKK